MYCEVGRNIPTSLRNRGVNFFLWKTFWSNTNTRFRRVRAVIIHSRHLNRNVFLTWNTRNNIYICTISDFMLFSQNSQKRSGNTFTPRSTATAMNRRASGVPSETHRFWSYARHRFESSSVSSFQNLISYGVKTRPRKMRKNRKIYGKRVFNKIKNFFFLDHNSFNN